MEFELQRRDQRISQLEAVVAEQLAKIAELESLAGSPTGSGSAREEVEQLQAIIEAQEAALNEQRQIMESQGGLVDELNRQLQSQISNQKISEQAEVLLEEQRVRIGQLEAEVAALKRGSSGGSRSGGLQEEEKYKLMAIIEAQESALSDQRQVIASQSSLIDELGEHMQPRLSNRQREPATPRSSTAEEPPTATGSGASAPGGAVGPSAGARGAARRRPNDAASPPAPNRDRAPVGSMRGASNSFSGALTRRTHQLTQQKVLGAAAGPHQQPQVRTDLPRPRPNSVLGGRTGSGGSGGTPRARSTTIERQSSRGSSPPPVRGSSPSGAPRQPTMMPRRAGGPVPPALPLLRQEA